jgi:hypothetical protein
MSVGEALESIETEKGNAINEQFLSFEKSKKDLEGKNEWARFNILRG